MDEVQARQRREREAELAKQREAEKDAASAMEVGRRVFVPDDAEVWLLGTITKSDREKALFTIRLDTTDAEVTVDLKSKKMIAALGPDCKALPLPNWSALLPILFATLRLSSPRPRLPAPRRFSAVIPSPASWPVMASKRLS